MSKTPRFDEALDKIFETLVPHARTCKQCADNFNIEEGDIEFLKKLRVPPPTLCPRCRLQRRMLYRCNLRPVFHKKKCSAPGHSEEVLTFMDESSSAQVYDDDYYRSDAWDAAEFASSYNPALPFFEQFKFFIDKIPHQTLGTDQRSTNSKYCVSGRSASNCYYVSAPYFSENLQYGSAGLYSKDSVDFADLLNSENCYSSVGLYRCFGCRFCDACSDCLDSFFLYDCKSCSECFGAINAHYKKYLFFNEQLTKEEYQERIANINLGSYPVLQEYKKKFAELVGAGIRKNLDNQKVSNSLGNNLRQCDNCYDCFRIIDGGENLRHAVYTDKVNDSMDIFGAGNNELIYESSGVNNASHVNFSAVIRTGQYVEYSRECNNVSYVFACFGLKNKQFCIFNKQYTEEEYWPLVDEIKTGMLINGEYGEFFPASMSQVAYNDSSAQIEFPLTKDEVLARGWRWHDPDPLPDIRPESLIKAADLPDNIKDAGDDILHKAVLCKETGRPFRLTPFELNFYRRHNLPLPRLHPDVRIWHLLRYRIPYRLWDDVCKKCGEDMKSGYDPAKGYNVYCEKCYQNEIV